MRTLIDAKVKNLSRLGGVCLDHCDCAFAMSDNSSDQRMPLSPLNCRPCDTRHILNSIDDKENTHGWTFTNDNQTVQCLQIRPFGTLFRPWLPGINPEHLGTYTDEK